MGTEARDAQPPRPSRESSRPARPRVGRRPFSSGLSTRPRTIPRRSGSVRFDTRRGAVSHRARDANPCSLRSPRRFAERRPPCLSRRGVSRLRSCASPSSPRRPSPTRPSRSRNRSWTSSSRPASRARWRTRPGPLGRRRRGWRRSSSARTAATTRTRPPTGMGWARTRGSRGCAPRRTRCWRSSWSAPPTRAGSLSSASPPTLGISTGEIPEIPASSTWTWTTRRIP
mmetsp:Transcript_11900/g.47808  ORF Transcript_11900/g.47808 Transcript_11900/m.47808 type:complete len:228 (-) Transcript_11900:955-1638(-)